MEVPYADVIDGSGGSQTMQASHTGRPPPPMTWTGIGACWAEQMVGPRSGTRFVPSCICPPALYKRETGSPSYLCAPLHNISRGFCARRASPGAPAAILVFLCGSLPPVLCTPVFDTQCLPPWARQPPRMCVPRAAAAQGAGHANNNLLSCWQQFLVGMLCRRTWWVEVLPRLAEASAAVGLDVTRCCCLT